MRFNVPGTDWQPLPWSIVPDSDITLPTCGSGRLTLASTYFFTVLRTCCAGVANAFDTERALGHETIHDTTHT